MSDAAAPVEITPSAADPALCWSCSKRFRRSLVLYKIKPKETLLAHLMCLETFDSCLLVGKVDLEKWCRDLGIDDSDGLRTDKCLGLLQRLHDLGICDWNDSQGTYELRPDAVAWTHSKGIVLRGQPAHDKEQELPLRGPRPLSESMSDLSRDAAQQAESGGAGCERNWPLFFSKSRELVKGQITHEQFYEWAQANGFPEATEDSGGKIRRPGPAYFPGDPAAKSAGAQNPEKTGESGAVSVPAAKSAGYHDKSCHEQALREKHEQACTMAAAAAAKSAGDGAANRPAIQYDLAADSERSMRVAGAWQWVQSVDVRNDLRTDWICKAWGDLCQKDPHYVLSKLRGIFQDNRHRVENRERDGEGNLIKAIEIPLKYLAYVARQEKKMKRVEVSRG